MSLGVQTRRIAIVAIFAAIYAILDQIPVSKLIGVSSTLTMGEVFSPLAGMILGPFAGGASVVLGTFAAVVLGRPLAFDGLDFIPALMAAVTAGLAIKRKVVWVVVLSLALVVVYSLDPFSLPVMTVDSAPVPYYWLQLVGLGAYLLVTLAARKGYRAADGDALVAAIVFLSTMNAEVGGGIMYENVLVLTGVLSSSFVIGFWPVIFWVYPIERAFFTIVGSVLAIPVLRAIPGPTLEVLRGGRRKVREEPLSPAPSP